MYGPCQNPLRSHTKVLNGQPLKNCARKATASHVVQMLTRRPCRRLTCRHGHKGAASEYDTSALNSVTRWYGCWHGSSIAMILCLSVSLSVCVCILITITMTNGEAQQTQQPLVLFGASLRNHLIKFKLSQLKAVGKQC